MIDIPRPQSDDVRGGWCVNVGLWCGRRHQQHKNLGTITFCGRVVIIVIIPKGQQIDKTIWLAIVQTTMLSDGVAKNLFSVQRIGPNTVWIIVE